MKTAISAKYVVMYCRCPVAVGENRPVRALAEKRTRRATHADLYWTGTGKLMAEIEGHDQFTGWEVAEVAEVCRNDI